MSVEIKGLPELLDTLDRRLSKEALLPIIDKALIAGAKEFVKILKEEFLIAGDKGYAKGYTLEEITVTGPYWDAGIRVIRIHWRGPHDRYRLIHLNEWGTINNPNPPRKGVIARAMKRSERVYRETVKKELQKAFGEGL